MQQRVEKLLQNGFIEYIDVALAEMLLRPFAKDEARTLFICHLSVASRNGHLCVKIKDNFISPHPKICWQMGKSSIDKNPIEIEWERIVDLIIQGAKNLPKELCSLISEGQLFSTPIGQQEDLFYFQRAWLTEKKALTHLQRLWDEAPSPSVNQKIAQVLIQSLCEEKKLQPKQADAIRIACTSSLTIISGGPGTGKTYTAGYLIRTLMESIPQEALQDFEIALAAPTGKAASNLQKSLKTDSLKTSLTVKTLHGLLKLNKYHAEQEESLPILSADLVLIDECSMIDATVMACLLASIKPGARLIMLGDPFQLPPVGSGMLFSDFITLLEKENSSKVVLLENCLRTDLQEIVEFSQAVKNGDEGQAFAMLHKKSSITLLQIAKANKPSHLYDLLFQQYASWIRKPSEKAPEEYLKNLSIFSILSPMRYGPLGFEELNRQVMLRMDKQMQHNENLIFPIILTKNDHKQELANGEIGILIRKKTFNSFEKNLKEGDYAIFPKNQEEKSYKKISALQLPSFEYAYCISVHKSQGSEWDNVLLLMPEGSEIFGRQIFYTAVTRTRKSLQIWSHEEVLSQTIRNPAERLSGIHKKITKDERCFV